MCLINMSIMIYFILVRLILLIIFSVCITSFLEAIPCFCRLFFTILNNFFIAVR